jgi:hypothetical protein
MTRWLATTRSREVRMFLVDLSPVKVHREATIQPLQGIFK